MQQDDPRRDLLKSAEHLAARDLRQASVKNWRARPGQASVNGKW